MNILVNGVLKNLPQAVSIADLLKINKVDKTDMVSVQLNGDFLDRQNFADTLVKENDEVDFLYFMGGGQQVVMVLVNDRKLYSKLGA